MSEAKDSVNPWISIPAAVYEGHMGSPGVRQLQFLSAVFREVLDRHRPASVVVLGCATGNGFEHVDPRFTKRVVGIDINPEYLAILVKRHHRTVPGLGVILGDIERCDLERRSVDLVHCALVLEYVDPRVMLEKTAAWLREDGVMSVVLQLPSGGQEKVSATEFRDALTPLEAIMRLVDPDEFTKLAGEAGFREADAEVRKLETGKEFFVGEYVREELRRA